MVVASVVGVLGAGGALLSWFVIHPAHPPPGPQGSAAAVGQSFAPALAWISFVVCVLGAVASAITLVITLYEARAARSSPRA